MKNFLFPLLLLVGAVLLVSACSATPTESVALAAPPVEEKAVPVEVATVQTGSMALVLTYPGTLEPKDEVEIIPGVSGRIVSVLVEVGDEVQAGDPIAIIDDDTYLAQLKQAEAALTSATLNLNKMELGSRPEEIAAAQAGVELARAQLNDVATISDDERTKAAAQLARTQTELKAAQSEYDKIAWAGDVGTTTQAQTLERATIAYQDALADYNLSVNPSDSALAPLMAQLAQAELQLALTLEPYRQIDFESARAAIAQAEAALELANIQLEEVVIKAPFEGTIAELNISQGSRVSQQTVVAQFLSQEMEVSLNVPERVIGQVEKGQSAALQVAAYPGQDFPGEVTGIAPKASKETRTFEVKVTLTQGAELLRSGMYADVSILAEEKQNTLLVPQSAVSGDNSEPFVYVVNEDNTVEQRPVKTGLYNQAQIEILAGLKAGETVVTAGQPNLTDGVKVRAASATIESTGCSSETTTC